MRRKVLGIIGPTAAGKTDLSIGLAERLNAEIISVDSRQVYRRMDIGTEKVSKEVQRLVPHHMIDVVDPDQKFSVSDFVDGAISASDDVFGRGRLPLFVGGTPFYYNALFHASMNSELPRDDLVRGRYEDIARSEGVSVLHRMLEEVDPLTAGRLHPNDVFRVSRAMELWELTKSPPSQLYREGRKRDFGLDVLYVLVDRPREELFSRIERRLKREFEDGFPEEVAQLIKDGFDERCNPMQGLGYRELSAWCRGKMTLEEAFERTLFRTRAFCRRQTTWFRKFSPVLVHDASCPFLGDELMDTVMRHLYPFS